LKGNPVFSSVAQKIVIGVTGLLLCGFVAAHLAGNLLLYSTDGNYKAFNEYAKNLHDISVLPVIEIGLLVLFLVHVVVTLWMQLKGSQARPEGYAVKKSKQGRGSIAAQNVMHLSGLIVLAFVLLHLADLRFDLRFNAEGLSPAQTVLQVLRDPVSAMFYTIGPLLLGYHLFHGFQSSFQSMGIGGERFMKTIKIVGIVFAVVVAIGFASLPVWVTLLEK
jgi:succinate dehydrogenase / fumarate reductase cytochrome b subunit